MIISMKKRNELVFSSIKPGDPFVWNGSIYMKIDTVNALKTITSDQLNAVSLITGILIHLDDNTAIDNVNLEIQGYY